MRAIGGAAATGVEGGKEKLLSPFAIDQPPKANCWGINTRDWSGRPGSNRRRPAWESHQPFDINNIDTQGFGSGASNTL